MNMFLVQFTIYKQYRRTLSYDGKELHSDGSLAYTVYAHRSE